jgi:hypothetical protein
MLLPNEWAYSDGGRQTYDWHKVPWWVFWRPKWFRRIYDRDRGSGWSIEYATDEQVARQTLEDRFGREKAN